jgi:hypothetical protein
MKASATCFRPFAAAFLFEIAVVVVAGARRV